MLVLYLWRRVNWWMWMGMGMGNEKEVWNKRPALVQCSKNPTLTWGGIG